MKVLVVEDDPTLSDLVATVAKMRGFDVEVFDSTEGVMEQIELPCTLLIDMTLVSGDGAALTRAIRSDLSTSDARVILLSGRRDLEEAARECGADGWLKKPFGLAELDEVLGRA